MPRDVCHGQSNLTGPWEDAAEASVAGTKRYRAQEKRWRDGVGSVTASKELIWRCKNLFSCEKFHYLIAGFFGALDNTVALW